MPTDEHDDDLSATVDDRAGIQTDDFPKTEEELTEGEEIEADDDDLVGK